ncbi:hypothetical protein [Sphingobacterium sp. GVS05A]|uniref:hypothetical protein n=1 Tax=Sphingobacterium sp. GVS05A TaxID=2862679 RepID=UPI001CC17AFF|nr:hypothetical protein [Sphingobacterium sp. GVS05A]
MVIISCKDQNDSFIENNKVDDISLLRADFEKQTGYDQTKVYLLTPAFRTRINWDKTVEKHKDTVLIAVSVLDAVHFPFDGLQVDLKNHVILKAVRNKDSKWNYSTVTFVPTDLSKGYSGLIISRSLKKGIEKIDYYNEGSILNNDNIIRRKFAVSASKNANKASAGLRAGCIIGYVNGMVNFVSCDNYTGTGGSSSQDTYGDPDDFEQMPIFDEGSVIWITPSKDDQDIIDSLRRYPCAQMVLAKLPNLENKISEWLSNTFVNSETYNITFRASTTLADTTDGEHYTGNISGKNQYITLNGNMLNTASQEYIAATMFHEALHGFLHMEKLRLEEKGTPEQFGVLYPGIVPTMIAGQQKFVLNHNAYGTLLGDLQKAIQSFSPNISAFDAMALAKGGVINLNTVEKSVNYANKKGNAGTTCN